MMGQGLRLPPTMLGLLWRPDGRVAAVRSWRGPDGRRWRPAQLRAAGGVWWTAATWPRWMPRPADGGLPQRLPGWMTRGPPRLARRVVMG
jgi:hypothetical protein